MSSMTRIGVVGAGRVGAVLGAALRGSRNHEIVAAAGESAASTSRIQELLPGVPVAKPTDVARACDLLLLAVPDDMLGNAVSMLVASGAIRSGQYVMHTSGLHGLAVLDPAAEAGAHVLAMHPAMTFTRPRPGPPAGQHVRGDRIRGHPPPGGLAGRRSRR